jgi:hypothetical protein
VGKAGGTLAAQWPFSSGIRRSEGDSGGSAELVEVASGTPGGGAATRLALDKVRFVPARVVERAAPERTGSQVEVVLGNGRLVRIVGAVDPKLLADTIRAIESLGAS